MLAQPASAHRLHRSPCHQLQNPAFAFHVPFPPYLVLPLRSHSLLSTHTLLGLYSRGEHSHPTWGYFVKKTGTPKTGTNFFLLPDLHETRQWVLQKKLLLISQIHHLSQTMPASVSVLLNA